MRVSHNIDYCTTLATQEMKEMKLYTEKIGVILFPWEGIISPAGYLKLHRKLGAVHFTT